MNKKKGEPISRHPLLSKKVRDRGEAFEYSESRPDTSGVYFVGVGSHTTFEGVGRRFRIRMWRVGGVRKVCFIAQGQFVVCWDAHGTQLVGCQRAHGEGEVSECTWHTTCRVSEGAWRVRGEYHIIPMGCTRISH